MKWEEMKKAEIKEEIRENNKYIDLNFEISFYLKLKYIVLKNINNKFFHIISIIYSLILSIK